MNVERIFAKLKSANKALYEAVLLGFQILSKKFKELRKKSKSKFNKNVFKICVFLID